MPASDTEGLAREDTDTWEQVEGGLGDHNGVDSDCHLISQAQGRRRAATAAVLSEHVYKISDARYTPESALDRLKLLCAHHANLIQLQGSVRVIPFEHAPPLVVASDVDTTYIAFRGTHHISDWLSGMRIGSSRMRGTPDGCELHRGFYSRARRYDNDKVHPLIQGALQGGRCVVLTGHSLGGAVASIKAAEALLLRKEWLLRQQLQEQQQPATTRQAISSIAFASPYWACAGLAEHLSLAGVSQHIHNFFNPTDRVEACSASVGFCPVGYFYYTGSTMLQKAWLAAQFSKAPQGRAARSGGPTPPDGPDPQASLEGCADEQIASEKFYRSREGTLATMCAAAVAVALLSGGGVLEVQGASHVDVDMLSYVSSKLAGPTQPARAPQGRGVRDFTIPYFMEVVYNRGAVVAESYDSRTEWGLVDSELRLGIAPGVYRTASPTSDFFEEARKLRLGQLVSPAGAADSPAPVTCRESASGADITFRPHLQGCAIEYVVGGEVRPPITRVTYERLYDGHKLRFPELGGRAAVLDATGESVEALRGIAAMCDAVGVEHDIPLSQQPSVLSWAKRVVRQAARTVTRIHSVAVGATNAVETAKEPHRIQVFVMSLLIAWTPRVSGAAAQCLVESRLQQECAEGISHSQTAGGMSYDSDDSASSTSTAGG